MPAEAGRQILECISALPGGTGSKRASACGRRSTRSTKSWPECWTCTSSPGTGRHSHVLEGMAAWADGWTAPKTEEHMQQILTIEFGGIAETLYSLAAVTNQRPMGQSRRPFPEEELHQSAGLAPRRTSRAARQHSYPAGDRGGAALRALGRHALPRCCGLLLLRGHGRALVRDGRHQQRRGLARPAAPPGCRIADERRTRPNAVAPTTC